MRKHDIWAVFFGALLGNLIGELLIGIIKDVSVERPLIENDDNEEEAEE